MVHAMTTIPLIYSEDFANPMNSCNHNWHNGKGLSPTEILYTFLEIMKSIDLQFSNCP